jgi:hypothetical protein
VRHPAWAAGKRLYHQEFSKIAYSPAHAKLAQLQAIQRDWLFWICWCFEAATGGGMLRGLQPAEMGGTTERLPSSSSSNRSELWRAHICKIISRHRWLVGLMYTGDRPAEHVATRAAELSGRPASRKAVAESCIWACFQLTQLSDIKKQEECLCGRAAIHAALLQ